MSLSRRTVLQSFGLVPLAAACGDDGSSATPDAGTNNGSADAAPDQCERIPAETAGPYPGNGTNGANALTLAGIVRSDIRSSVSPASGTADGVELTLMMRLTTPRRARRSSATPFTCGSATSTPTTRCTPVRRSPRTTCAACR